jgi:crossover junction endodeoxyribonuclease RuvC
MILILGIDPGSRITGYGIIKSEGSRQSYIGSGCIVTQSKDSSQRLKEIFTGISEVIQQHRPQEVAIEQVFVSHNVTSALKLGQARGAAIVAAASHSLTIAEYTTRRVKQSVVGYGGADKNQVQHMVKCLLNLSAKPAADAADALAVALCHAHMRNMIKAKEGLSIL